ncbi:hypothetical protein Tco_0838406 [Tanacetum coccineum]|uniref:Reverse transcriptase n=1 Tax=Tanacetum coccineum TaxID=301880 RepID=A0ABQ5AS85_9ASTR
MERRRKRVRQRRGYRWLEALYKIIAKVLANRLVDKLGSIVNEVQSAFVKDRQILDGPFILDELIQWCKKKRKHLLVKLMRLLKAEDVLPQASFSLIFGSTVAGDLMSRIQAWDGVVERVKSRLSKWKVKMLSIGGRLTLLKSVLGSMDIYQMSIHKAPLGVLRNIESLRSHFFNGCAPNNQRPPRGEVEQEQFMALLSSWSKTSVNDKTLPDATQKTRWVRLVPIKINVHAWKVKSNSLPTRFNISRRVRNLVDLIVRGGMVTRSGYDSYSAVMVLWILISSSYQEQMDVGGCVLNMATSTGSSFMNIDNDEQFASNTPIGNPLVPTGICGKWIVEVAKWYLMKHANLCVSTSGKDEVIKLIGAANDQLLKNRKAKFKWVANTADKLNIPPPPQLTDFELPPAERKRKRTTKVLKEVFVSEDIVVNAIEKPILIQNLIRIDSKYAQQVYDELICLIECRPDVVVAREIIAKNLDGMRFE